MIEACYYSILDMETEEIVDEGIIRNSEDTIYPGQNTGIDELPSECEAHHFQVKGYGILLLNFSISRDDLFMCMPAGTKLNH